MNIYHYSQSTGEYISTSHALADPLEKGRFLVPGFSTQMEPPAAAGNVVAIFNGVNWELQIDFRGVDYWLSDSDKRTINNIGEVVPEGAALSQPPAPLPTHNEIESAKIAVVQKHMDNAARAYRYDDIKTACTYAEESVVPKFQGEGRAFRTWRSLVWAACYAVLDEVQRGERAVPTDAELLDALPSFVAPE